MVGVDLPLNLVEALQHARLVVWVHEPIVVARVELHRPSQWLILAYLRKCSIGPLGHEHAQVQIIVHGVIMKLFLLNLVALVLVTRVHPMEQVEHLDGLCEELVVDLGTLDDVERQNVL